MNHWNVPVLGDAETSAATIALRSTELGAEPSLQISRVVAATVGLPAGAATDQLQLW